MHIRTMAVKIDFDTYPAAVACLGPGFASIPYPQVDGAYVVINAPDSRRPFRRISPYNRYGSQEPVGVTSGKSQFLWKESELMSTDAMRMTPEPIRVYRCKYCKVRVVSKQDTRAVLGKEHAKHCRRRK
jgi:uncharacterized protein YlaI